MGNDPKWELGLTTVFVCILFSFAKLSFEFDISTMNDISLSKILNLKERVLLSYHLQWKYQIQNCEFCFHIINSGITGIKTVSFAFVSFTVELLDS